MKAFTIAGDYSGFVEQVYDGCTLQVSMSFRQKEPELFDVRIAGYDTPLQSHRSRDYLRQWVLNKRVWVTCTGITDGRVTADVAFDGISICDHMIANGYGIKPSNVY